MVPHFAFDQTLPLQDVKVSSSRIASLLYVPLTKNIAAHSGELGGVKNWFEFGRHEVTGALLHRQGERKGRRTLSEIERKTFAVRREVLGSSICLFGRFQGQHGSGG